MATSAGWSKQNSDRYHELLREELRIGLTLADSRELRDLERACENRPTLIIGCWVYNAIGWDPAVRRRNQ